MHQLAHLSAVPSSEGILLNIEGTLALDGRSAPFPFRTVDTRGKSTCSSTPGGGVSNISTVFPKAKALLIAVTVVNSSVSSYLTAFSGSGSVPALATVNFNAREVRTSLAYVPVSGDRINIICGGGTPEYILDVLAAFE